MSMKTVNELSGKIDLPSTLLRAQSLFGRFQRTVEAIDKRNNFPTPTVRQRKPPSELESTVKPNTANPNAAKPVKKPNPFTSTTATTDTGTDARRASASGRRPPGTTTTMTASGLVDERPKERVISPELRGLLSRHVEVLEKKDVRQHGGGVGT